MLYLVLDVFLTFYFTVALSLGIVMQYSSVHSVLFVVHGVLSVLVTSVLSVLVTSVFTVCCLL